MHGSGNNPEAASRRVIGSRSVDDGCSSMWPACHRCGSAAIRLGNELDGVRGHPLLERIEDRENAEIIEAIRGAHVGRDFLIQLPVGRRCRATIGYVVAQEAQDEHPDVRIADES